MTGTRTEIVLTVALVSAVAVAAATAAPPAEGAGLRVACVAAMLTGSALAAWLGLRRDVSLRRLLGVAVVLRLLALPVAPSLSDDGYRYLWDGELVEAGISPYSHLPSDPALDGFRADPDHALLFDRMNSPGYYSVYPPVSQAVFAVAAWMPSFGVAWFTLKGLLVLAELVGIWCLSRVVPAGRVALYAWSPVAVLEIAGQGHTEALLVMAVGLLWFAVVQGRSRWLAAGVVLAGWAKLFPFVLAAILPKRLGAAGRFGFAAATLLFGAPLLVGDSLAHVVESVRLYGGTLDFYAAPYLALKAAVYPALGEPSGRVAASTLSVVWLLGLGLAWLKDDGSVEAARRLLLVGIGGYALTAAMAHPWNLLGLLALSPLMRSPGAALWLVGVAPLTYLRYVEVPGAYATALGLGWGGAALMWAASRYRASGRRSDTVAVSASSQR